MLKASATAAVCLLLSGALCEPDKELSPWQRKVAHGEKRVYTQSYQDGVLEQIFTLVGTTNRYFVEFGFNAPSYDAPQSGANTKALHKKGWNGLLLDGNFVNPAINLRRAMLGPHTIVSTFEKYQVPQEFDYLSIDFDSYDVWVFLALGKSKYRARVVTVEYNSAHPASSTTAQAFPHRDNYSRPCSLFGSSLGALEAVGKEIGYTLVYVVPGLDAFFVRTDLLGSTRITPIAELRPHRLYAGYVDAAGNYVHYSLMSNETHRTLGGNHFTRNHVAYWSHTRETCRMQDAPAKHLHEKKRALLRDYPLEDVAVFLKTGSHGDAIKAADAQKWISSLAKHTGALRYAETSATD